MITREQIEIALGEDKNPFKNLKEDHDVKAIILLRERIPYEVCKSIVCGASHGVVYLCDVGNALEYLSEEDLEILADCNIWVDDDRDCFAFFV